MAPQPFIPLPNGAQVEVFFFLDSQVVENRLWFWAEQLPIDQANLDNLASGVYTWHTTRILPYLSSAITLQVVAANDWSSYPPPFTSITGTPLSGGLVEPCHSANVSVVMPFRWPLGFRRLKQNKHYIPGIPYSAVDTNDVNHSWSDPVWEGYAALIDDAPFFDPPTRWRWIVTSRRADNAWRTEQLFEKCQGPPPNEPTLKLGQRRKRLP
jgi:hypothetical protein